MFNKRKHKGRRIVKQDVQEISLVDVPASAGQTAGADIVLFKTDTSSTGTRSLVNTNTITFSNIEGDEMPKAVVKKEDNSNAEENPSTEINLEDLSDDVKDYIQSLNTQLDELLAEKESAKVEVEEESTEELVKSLPEDAKALFETMQKKVDDSSKAAADAIRLAKELEEDKIKEVYKAQTSTLKNVVGGDKADDYIEIMKALPKELATKLHKLFEDAEAALTNGDLTKEIGSAVKETNGFASEVEKRTQELINSNSDLDFTEALVKVMTDSPDLYDQYHSEKGK